MRINPVLLSATAVIVGVSSASAADVRGSKKAAPVEAVRICSVGDVTGLVIPGTDTCLKIAGRIRAEYRYAEPFARSAHTTTFLGRGYATLDTITNSDWGPVRATSRIFVTRETGTAAAVTLDFAYLQFSGVTAGRLGTSFFEFAPFGGVSYEGGGSLGRGSDYGSINALAYTVTAGNLVATLALEDGTERRSGLQQLGAAGLGVSPSYGGHVMPDLVGRLDYTDSWGQAALTGAVHQSRAALTGATAALNAAGGIDVSAAGGLVDSSYGFAVQGGLKVNLPMLAPGDAIFLQAAYASGASSYTGWGGQAGTVAPVVADVIYTAAGAAKPSNSWSVTGGLLHYWTPSVRQGVFGAYGVLDQFGANFDTAAVSAGTNLIWTPVRNLDIGAEVTYSKLTETPRSALPLPVGSARDNWGGRIRFERDF